VDGHDVLSHTPDRPERQEAQDLSAIPVAAEAAALQTAPTSR
jgi:hypothetical protein